MLDKDTTQEIVDATKVLMSMRPVDKLGVESALRHMKGSLESDGWQTRHIETAHGQMLETRVGAANARHKVLWLACLRVADGRDEHFYPLVEDDRLVGRGAQDMLLAAMCMRAALAMAVDVPEAQVRLAYVTDRAAIADYAALTVDDAADFAIFGERTALSICDAYASEVGVELTVTGTPDSTNPISVKHRLMSHIDDQMLAGLGSDGPLVMPIREGCGYPEPGGSLPRHATVEYVVRPSPGQDVDALLGEFEALLELVSEDVLASERKRGIQRPEAAPPITMRVSTRTLPTSAPFGHPYLQAFGRIVRQRLRLDPEQALFHASGGRFLPIPGVGFGITGSERRSDVEWADLKSIAPYIKTLLGHLRELPLVTRRAAAGR